MATVRKYLNDDVGSEEDALKGARHIIAEWISEDNGLRAQLRSLYERSSSIQSKVRNRKSNTKSQPSSWEEGDEQAQDNIGEHDGKSKKKKKSTASSSEEHEKKEVDPLVFSDYFDRTESHAMGVPSHRILAMMRGQREGVLSLTIRPREEEAFKLLKALWYIHHTPPSKLHMTPPLNRINPSYPSNPNHPQYSGPTLLHSRRYFPIIHDPKSPLAMANRPVPHQTRDSLQVQQMALAIEDAYQRLLHPSMQTHMEGLLFDRASDYSIGIFAANLRQLLLASPLGQRRVLAIDPGFRTGCKIVVLDKQGKLLHNTLFYLPQMGKKSKPNDNTHDSTIKDTPSSSSSNDHILLQLCRQYDIDAIAIGNGTASRETDALVRSLKLPASIEIVSDMIMIMIMMVIQSFISCCW